MTKGLLGSHTETLMEFRPLRSLLPVPGSSYEGQEKAEGSTQGKLLCFLWKDGDVKNSNLKLFLNVVKTCANNNDKSE